MMLLLLLDSRSKGGKEQQEAVRGEKARLDSLASVEKARELWRLRDEKVQEHKDEAGIWAGEAWWLLSTVDEHP